MNVRIAAFAMVFVLACGGTQAGKGDSSGAGGGGDDTVDPIGGGGGDTTAVATDAGPTDAAGPVEPEAAVTFVLANTADEDLVFSIDKGWQPVIFAFSGKPPKAVPIVMFAKHCTASCDAVEEERCPYCPPPETAKAEREGEQRVVVAAGAEHRVPWDGGTFVYEKTTGTLEGKKAKCECWRRAEPAPATYTVRACGFRVTKEAGKQSKYQCVEGSMTLPPAETPMEVRLEFPAEKTGKKKKKK